MTPSQISEAALWPQSLETPATEDNSLTCCEQFANYFTIFSFAFDFKKIFFLLLASFSTSQIGGESAPLMFLEISLEDVLHCKQNMSLAAHLNVLDIFQNFGSKWIYTGVKSCFIKGEKQMVKYDVKHLGLVSSLSK